MRLNKGGSIAALCLALIAGAAQYGPAGRLAHAAMTRTAVSQRITLDVVVTDTLGKPVSNLRRDDFTVLDNKRPQQLLSVVESGAGKGESPVEVVLVVDEINASFQEASAARQHIKVFLRRNGGKLPAPVSLVFATDSETVIGDRSYEDGNAVIAEMDRRPTGTRVVDRSQAEDGAIEQVRLSMSAMERIISHEAGKPGRKLVVWVSPGWPYMPRTAPEPSAAWRQGLFESIVALSDGMRRARITLYAADPLGMSNALGAQAVHYKGFLRGVTGPDKVESGHFGLPVLATNTGGLVLNRNNDLANEIATCVADAARYYTLTFDAPPAASRIEYRDVEVQVGKPGLKARTRTGYYAHAVSR